MLGPYDRLQLVSELRPPEGFEFDGGFGTTYSLDLESLLIVPLSLVLCEFESREEALSNPEAVLEGLRRVAGKLHIFCHRGRIKRPKEGLVQFSFLEDTVVEVLSSDPLSFHPKVWVLRYRKESETLVRLLVLSRNLTFDRCWDTALVLDGLRQPDRERNVKKNARLARFIRALPRLAGASQERLAAPLESLAADVLKTEFELPESFDDIAFWPLGIDESRPNHLLEGPHGRMMIISPFLSDLSDRRRKGVLDLLLDKRTSVAQNVLVSRAEELDKLKPESLQALSETTDIYVLDDAALTADQAPELSEEPPPKDDLGVPSGLHAKVYVVENGAEVSIFTGSANATTSGWGRSDGSGNVEFVVELRGARRKVGIDALLGVDDPEESGGRSLQKLLKRYRPPTDAVSIDPDETQVEQLLEEARCVLSASAFTVQISGASNGDGFDAALVGAANAVPEGVDVWAWPMMLPQGRAQKLSRKALEARLEFPSLTVAALTPFWAFRIRAKVGKAIKATDFVLRLPTVGMPEERTAMLLAQMINTSDRFLRYLVLLLSDDAAGTGVKVARRTDPSKSANGAQFDATQLLVFEELVRAFSRNPKRLERVDALMADLKKGGAGAEVIPKEFEEIWPAFRPTAQ